MPENRCGSCGLTCCPDGACCYGEGCIYPSGDTAFQWLIERGQPEGEERPAWLEHSLDHPARDREWTTEAREAAMFPNRDTAEAYIAEQGLEARAVEHGFMVAAPPESEVEAWLTYFRESANPQTAEERWEYLDQAAVHIENLLKAESAIRAEKDERIKRLTRRVEAYRQAIWEHLIYPDDDGRTASGYSQEDIPDELLIDAVVDAT